jgi:hypothetical protein
MGLDTPLEAKQTATKLNNPFEIEEVAVAFHKLKRGKAAGPGGLRAVFVKDAIVREYEG